MKEIWKEINYKDIIPGRYEVSDMGNFRKMKSKKEMNGCNPKNERGGYHRIALKTINGKIKKFQKHRIVMATFGYLTDNQEVNHKNGKKYDNSYTNLEATDRKGNAKHAAENNLYQKCEDHYRSNFTNEEVENICKLISEGYPISEVIDIMNLHDGYGDIYSNIDKIINGKAWKSISSKYNFDYNKYHYKTYSYDDIWKMCECIFHKKNEK